MISRTKTYNFTYYHTYIHINNKLKTIYNYYLRCHINNTDKTYGNMKVIYIYLVKIKYLKLYN